MCRGLVAPSLSLVIFWRHHGGGWVESIGWHGRCRRFGKGAVVFHEQSEKMKKYFCCEDDKKIAESVSEVHRWPREIGWPSVPLIVADEV